VSTAGQHGKLRVGLGLRALRGGSVIVAIGLEKRQPRMVLSSFLATAADDDRLSREPYHVAFEMPRGPDGGPSADAAAAVVEGRKRQDQLAAENLADIARTLRAQEREPAVAGLLVNRAGWVTDLLSYSLAFADHPPVAEGLAVREALRFALGQCRIDMTELDEKTLPALALETLSLPSADIDAHLKRLGTAAGRPWRKEQKLACLAAWVALVASG
jgi:hypothetical protein